MQGMMSMAGAGDDESVDMVETMEDCCNDMATFERTGQSCKSAQSCVVTALGTPSFTALSAPTQVTHSSSTLPGRNPLISLETWSKA
jgi:hypothetical protein